MSQPKRDIADFFRPLAKSIPRKRSNPDSSEDRASSISSRNTPSTPNADRKTHISNIDRAGTPQSSTHSLMTPRSGRSVNIPFRSPGSVTPSAVHTVRKFSTVGASEDVEVSPSRPSAVQPSSEIPSSNRTVFENGKKVAVCDSDDSDDSLQSLSDLIGRKRDARTTIDSSQSEALGTHEQEGRQLLNLFSSGRSEAQRSRAKLRELQKRQQENKVDLSYIFEDERKDAAARERIAELTAEESEVSEQDMKLSSTSVKENLATVLKGSDDEEAAPEGLNRLLHAVNRTEALSTQKSYAFFNNKEVSSVHQFTKFPATAIPGNLFKPNDSSACKRMFLSGFMSEMASKGQLNDDAIRWTFNMISREQHEDVLEAYLGCISAGSARWTRANIGPTDVQMAFEQLGLNENVSSESIEGSFSVRSEPSPRRYQLLVSTLELFTIVCEDLDFTSLSRLCSIVCRLLVDEQTMSHHRVSKAANQLCQRLLDLPDQESRQHVHDRLLEDLGANLKDPLLQALTLQNLVSTTTSWLQLKTELATAFLQNRESMDDRMDPSAAEKNRLAVILAFLSSSRDFSVRSVSDLGSSTFYTTLHALTVVLDAAIGDGDPPINFLDRNEEHHFNADVDRVARHIEKLYSSIPDSGASHMTRTEAKNALLDLQHRLLSAVRTRQKKRRNIFDDRIEGDGGKKKLRFSDVHEVEEESKKRDFMARFLYKKPALKDAASNRQSSADEVAHLNT